MTPLAVSADVTESFGAGYLEKSTQYYSGYLSTARTENGNLDQVAFPVTVYISLIVSPSLSIKPKYSLPQGLLFLSSQPMVGWGATGVRRKRLLKTGAEEQSADPHPASPGAGK